MSTCWSGHSHADHSLTRSSQFFGRPNRQTTDQAGSTMDRADTKRRSSDSATYGPEGDPSARATSSASASPDTSRDTICVPRATTVGRCCATLAFSSAEMRRHGRLGNTGQAQLLTGNDALATRHAWFHGQSSSTDIDPCMASAFSSASRRGGASAGAVHRGTCAADVRHPLAVISDRADCVGRLPLRLADDWRAANACESVCRLHLGRHHRHGRAPACRSSGRN